MDETKGSEEGSRCSLCSESSPRKREVGRKKEGFKEVQNDVKKLMQR